MEKLLKQLREYRPYNEQEERDQKNILKFLTTAETPFLRDNELCHMTASAWVVNKERTKVLMAYHNIYNSWSWTGGHADGETDLYSVALREVREETGVQNIRPISEEIFSIETLIVEGHEKRGKYVTCHLHMNVTYLFEADETDDLQIKPDENSKVGWIPADELEAYVTEPWMMSRIYSKLVEKSRNR
ncbi:MAG: NUDIX hydrolase [Clostridiales bacterium]|nr:NUDIX hydrolase [Candidatus Blautia equi]